MAEEAPHELIIIKREEEEEHAAHSSAWKVAHADFMTAMMAFFLIMWLINVTDDQVRKGISQYFNPIHLSQGSTDLKGLNAPDPNNTQKSGKKGPNTPPEPAAPVNPVQLTAGSGNPAPAPAPATKAIADNGASSAPPTAGSGAAAAAATSAGTAAAGSAAQPAPLPAAAAATLPVTAGNSPGAGGAAYQDPYAALAKTDQGAGPGIATSPDTVPGDPRALGAAGGSAARDPFDPMYWQLTQLPPARADNPGSPGTIGQSPPATGQPDVRAVSSAAAPAAATTAPAKPADASIPPPATPNIAEPADAAASPDSVAAAKVIADTVAKTASPLLAGAAPQVSVKATAEGTLIGLTDDAAYSMFPVGSTTPDAKVVALMGKIAGALAKQPGDVIIRGYTDGRPFHTADNDNWRLSAARARTAYDLLTAAGLAESRVVSIEGHADRDLLNPADPYAAENRRIEILLKVDGK